jgi:hypothetical protein
MLMALLILLEQLQLLNLVILMLMFMCHQMEPTSLILLLSTEML